MSAEDKNLEALDQEDKASKASSEATAPQASPKKMNSNDFHHHVVPTEKSGALNVYVQVICLMY